MNYIDYFNTDKLIELAFQHHLESSDAHTPDFIESLIQAWPELPKCLQTTIYTEVKTALRNDRLYRTWPTDDPTGPAGRRLPLRKEWLAIEEAWKIWKDA